MREYGRTDALHARDAKKYTLEKNVQIITKFYKLFNSYSVLGIHIYSQTYTYFGVVVVRRSMLRRIVVYQLERTAKHNKQLFGSVTGGALYINTTITTEIHTQNHDAFINNERNNKHVYITSSQFDSNLS